MRWVLDSTRVPFKGSVAEDASCWDLACKGGAGQTLPRCYLRLRSPERGIRRFVKIVKQSTEARYVR